jgi:hypothetical protein
VDAHATGRLTTMAAGDYVSIRASDHDRWRVQTHLNEAFAEGRLTQQEWDERVTALASARTYGDLDMLTADLPRPTALAVPQAPGLPYPQPQTSGPTRAGLTMGHIGLIVAVIVALLLLLVSLRVSHGVHMIVFPKRR